MKKYFCFFEENILNVQKNNVSIYNILDGRIYYYDGLEAEFIKNLSNTSDIELSIKKSKISNQLAEDLLASLYRLELGLYSDHFIASLELIEPPYWRDLLFFKTSPSLHRAYIIFGENCENNCIYCKKNNCGKDYILENRCFSCFGNKNNPNFNQIKIFIKKISLLECKEIILVGGDLVIDIDYLNLICELLPHNMNKKIILGYYSKYSNNIDNISDKFDEVYININEKEFFIEKTGVFLDGLKNKEKYNIIIITENGNFFKENKITIEKNGNFKSISVSRIINKNDLEDIISKEDLYVPSTSINQYMYKNIYNTCLNGLITLSGNGELSVCPMIPELKVGSVYDFDVALKYSNINKYWRLNKTNIDLCKECSLNSTCYDCRFIAYYLFGDIKSMYTCNKVNQLKATIKED